MYPQLTLSPSWALQPTAERLHDMDGCGVAYQSCAHGEVGEGDVARGAQKLAPARAHVAALENADT
eukprot:7854-Eustigmatos_ZCMA.PRE.1